MTYRMIALTTIIIIGAAFLHTLHSGGVKAGLTGNTHSVNAIINDIR